MTQSPLSYHEEKKIKDTEKTRELLNQLPLFCKELILDTQDNIQKSSQVEILLDIKLFFEFIRQNNKEISEINQITPQILEEISLFEFNEYKDWLSGYSLNGVWRCNEAAAKRRKIASLKTLYKFLLKANYIQKNITTLIELPKVQDKEIITLSSAEKKKLLAAVEKGDTSNKRNIKLHQTTMLRDLAIVTLLLSSAIRISELVGLDLDDIDFVSEPPKIYVQRKGGKRDHVYIGEDTLDALLSYLDYCRNNLTKGNEENQALFISRNQTRLTVRAIEKMLTKYADIAFGSGHQISPHKLRSTRGSQLYNETGDINAVKAVLGHSSIVTSSKYYVKTDEERKKISTRPI